MPTERTKLLNRGPFRGQFMEFVWEQPKFTGGASSYHRISTSDTLGTLEGLPVDGTTEVRWNYRTTGPVVLRASCCARSLRAASAAA